MMYFSENPLELEPHNMVSGTIATIVLFTIHVAVPLLFVGITIARAIASAHRGRVADAQGGGESPLAPGPMCIRGAVELAPGSEIAVRVEIDQLGAEHKGKGKDNWSHSWTELARRTTAAGFFVLDDRGRVRVEPDDRTLLIDKLDREVPKSKVFRTRVAEVTEGEQVYVVGVLDGAPASGGGAYRETSGVVMRAPADGRLLISTEPLGDRFRAAMRMQRGFAIFFAAFMLVFAVFDLGVYLRFSSGRSEVGTIVRTKHHGGKGPYCELDVELPSKKVVNVDTGSSLCSNRSLKARGPDVDGARVNVFVVGDDSFAHLGSVPAIHIANLGIAAFLLVCSIVAYFLRARPWYESKVVDRVPGKLPAFKG